MQRLNQIYGMDFGQFYNNCDKLKNACRNVYNGCDKLEDGLGQVFSDCDKLK